MILSLNWESILDVAGVNPQAWREDVIEMRQDIAEEARTALDGIKQTGQKLTEDGEKTLRKAQEILRKRESELSRTVRTQGGEIAETLRRQAKDVESQFQAWKEGAQAWSGELRDGFFAELGLSTRKDVDRLKKQVRALQQRVSSFRRSSAEQIGG